MRGRLAALLLTLLAGPAAAHPVDLEIDAGSLNIAAVVHTDGRVTAVRVANQEALAIRCDAVFRNGPEVARTRRAIIAPGDSAALSWTPRRTVVRLRVELRCEPHE
jgi:hypothetical protein